VLAAFLAVTTALRVRLKNQLLDHIKKMASTGQQARKFGSQFKEILEGFLLYVNLKSIRRVLSVNEECSSKAQILYNVPSKLVELASKVVSE
jgi:hypothetical protein